MLPQREPTFFIVDDDDVAVMAIQRLMRKLGIANPREVARDGAEALAKLRGDGAAPVQRPYIILLDINMPRMGGLEFLDHVRRDPALRDSVVFMVTTSDAAKDIARAYDQSVAGYIVRSGTTGAMKSALEMLAAYSKVVRLPD